MYVDNFMNLIYMNFQSFEVNYNCTIDNNFIFRHLNITVKSKTGSAILFFSGHCILLFLFLSGLMVETIFVTRERTVKALKMLN